MSKLHDNSITIYDALRHIQEGKYVMPAFQRQYVWNMEQIEKLWDSILLDYPIATFLFWHVDDSNVTWDTNVCNFLTRVVFDSRRQPDSANYDLSNINVKISDTAILDGQQRLTSLYLSLFGEAHIRQRYSRKKNDSTTIAKLVVELNQNKLSVDEEEYNSKKYDIKFTEKAGKLSPTQFEIRTITENRFQNDGTREQAIEEAIKNVPENSKTYARAILKKLYDKIFVEKLIRYTEIWDMRQDDALEMFVRFNSGGKALRKSEITMSILEAYWPSAKAEFGKILINSYEGFGTDFIIRTALMLYGDVVKSNISKQIADDLRNNWDDFKRALRNLEALLRKMKIDISRFSSSWNILLPIIYAIYYNDDYEETAAGIRAYLIRASLFSFFQSGTTGKLQRMKSAINDNDWQITTDMLNDMSELRVTDGRIEDILNMEKGSRVAGEALYYLSLDWLNRNTKYEQDHLHPYERFEGTNPIGVSLQDWKRWRSLRNRLPNLQLLAGRTNASKSDMRLIDYYNDMDQEQQSAFRKEAMIPDNTSLELENFETFYEQRKLLMSKRLRELLQ